MNLKKFHEKDMQTALKKVRDELGDNAVIISTEDSTYGVEITAAADYEAVANSDVTVEPSLIAENYSATNDFEKSLPELTNSNSDKSESLEINLLYEEVNQLRSVIESQTEILSWNKLLNNSSNARNILQ